MDFQQQLTTLITTALKEDMGPGDYSTLSTIHEQTFGSAILKVKQQGMLAGVAVAESIFKYFQSDVKFSRMMNDGDQMMPGNIAFKIEGFAQTILSCERLVLNCMQRMSGIATLTNEYTRILEGYHTKILDTRKTTPNFRLLEKEAVKIGGGYNHRFGLYDMIMLKDNHIDYCGGIEPAIEKAYSYVKEKGLDLKIEIETRSIEDVKAVLRMGKVDRIMLDNFTPADTHTAVVLINGEYETEASGGIHLGNIREYADTGVDYISSGAIIHQAVSLDLSLKAQIV